MSDNKQASNAILKGIKHLINKEIENISADKTYTGIIQNIKEDNLYDVLINGNLYTNLPSIFTDLKIYDSVKVKIPQGQYSQMYIDGKYNMSLSGTSSGFVTTVNGETGDVIVVEDKTYVYKQLEASDVWIIEHNLNKYPNVTIVDSGDNVVFGDTHYDSENQITINFIGAFSGKAFLN